MARPVLTSKNIGRALFVLCVVAWALAAASAGCSSGAICYRNTDCPVGAHCKDGQCLMLVSDPGDAGAQSQTPDAN
jgi:hypothetical protein